MAKHSYSYSRREFLGLSGAGIAALMGAPWSGRQAAAQINSAREADLVVFNAKVYTVDPLVPRAMFGILNTLLFFPSGSIYPIQAFPPWLRAIARVDPFTYAVDGFKCLLLKETTLAAAWGDMLFLSIFAAITLGIAIPLFKRTL